MLAQGVELGAQDKNGNTALHSAVTGRGSEQVIKYLLNDAHADPEVRNAKGQTVFAAAEAKRGGEAMVSLLQSLGLGDPAAGAEQPPVATGGVR